MFVEKGERKIEEIVDLEEREICGFGSVSCIEMGFSSC